MQTAPLNIPQEQVHKLLCAASGDAALLYIYLQSGNPLQEAAGALQLSASRLQCAAAMLRQLGLWQEEKPAAFIPGERPQYSERDVLSAMDTDRTFHALYTEVQRLLGKPLNTEELKILLGIVRYLGLPHDVIGVLIHYCKERALRRGRRSPSLRAIEKEAYAWAEKGIDTMEDAVAFIQNETMRASRLGRLLQILQIRGRDLTAAENRYAQQWLDWGFSEDALAEAYERTCLNTGALNWAYMNKILLRWQQNGLLTLAQIKSSDAKPLPKGASGQLGSAELEAIQKVLQED